MLKIEKLRYLIHTVTVLIDAAVKNEVDRSQLSLALIFSFISMRSVGRSIGCSHQTAARVTKRLLKLKLPLPNFDDMTKDELYIIFYPDYKKRVSSKRAIPVEKLVKETSIRPKKHGMNLYSIWLQYFRVEPSSAYSYAHFCLLWRRYCRSNRHEVRFDYKPGELMACDYAGIQGVYVEKQTGKKVKLHMFVAVLAHSNLLFAYFTTDLTAKSWCRAIVKALHFFGGVPAVIQFDNASLVKKPGLIEEFNEQFIVLSRYYRTAGLAIRPRSPKDNAIAEKSVQFIQARVLVPMKRECFYSLEDAQSHLLNEVEVLNKQPMQKLKVSRRTLFEQKETQALSPITRSEYQPFDERCQRTSTSNGTVCYNNHEYSVPYEMSNKKLTLQVTGTKLTVLDDYKEIACHALSNEHRGASIKKEHNHPNQNYEDSKNEFEFLSWAESLDDSVVEVVKNQYLGVKSSQSRRAGNNCLALQKLCKSAGEESLIAACQYAVTHGLTRITQIMAILDSELYLDTQDEYEDELPAFLTQTHKNIRGVEQIRGARHV